jgi:hypothetical protein
MNELRCMNLNNLLNLCEIYTIRLGAAINERLNLFCYKF